MPSIRWIYKDTPPVAEVQTLAKSLNIQEALAYLLVQRNITEFEDAKRFFRPQLAHLHDPFLMKDMDKAVARLQEAIKNEEKILVFGDYDVDGTTSVALVYSFLRKRYQHLEYYIPDRYKEGYGVSKKGIEYARDNDFKLIICLDCGVKSVELIAFAKAEGVDFIVCDHHLPGKQIPPAVAVLDPKQLDCAYPYKELSGCGVGFKLLQAYCQTENINLNELYQFLDLTVVSIACDIVPITGENRVLAYYGLDKLNKKPLMGFQKLSEIAGFKDDKDLTITNVLFGLGPRINAAGRIESGTNAVQLLVSTDSEIADKFAQYINENNKDRKDFDKNITEQALQMILDNSLQETCSTVLYKETWHKGVIGIVASRCIENYYRPTIILTKSGEGKAAGSARSVDGFDVHDAIEQCSELLEQFGGHTHAAGLTLKIENIEAFQRKFEQVVSQKILPDQLIPKIEVDMKLHLKDANDRFMRILNQLSPFGPGNMQPMFVSENVVAIENKVSIVGKENPIHLKMTVKHPNSAEFEAIGFSMSHHAERIRTGEPFHICYHLEENHFNGKTTLQLRLKDIKFND
jgi:single-stranded-DNA-specific exonuclease